jgi:hypothetical protein
MAWINFLEFVYPVGSVYFSTINTSPASVIGGTWSQLTGGMLGLAGSEGVASAGSDGGSIKISIEQMPPHRHREEVAVNATGFGGQAKATSNIPANYTTDEDWSIQSTGGGRILFLPIPLSMLGSALLKGGER